MDQDPVDHERALPAPAQARTVLYWIPLGAGATVVRRSGRMFEALSSWIQHRPACDLYHSAIEVTLGADRCTIEMTPVPAPATADRGVVADGAVGSAWLRPLRIFRYEIRRWTGGTIPDAGAAVGGPIFLTAEQSVARRIFELVPMVPTPVWGRDELQTGEMWNSNSVTSWLLARAGVDCSLLEPPAGGRAPGWDAGLVVADRSAAPSASVGPSPAT